jgi:hypothetical protein
MLYARVPHELQEPLLRDIRRQRRRSALLLFPVLLLILSAAAAAFLFTKGHALLHLLQQLLGRDISTTTYWLIVSVGLVLCVGVFLVICLRQMCRECDMEELPFCDACKTVDDTSKGICPKCENALHAKANFFSTTYGDEQKLLNRYGFVMYSD